VKIENLWFSNSQISFARIENFHGVKIFDFDSFAAEETSFSRFRKSSKNS